MSRAAAPVIPADITRILHVFDFEERALGNNEDQPMHWQKVESADYPNYVMGRLTTDHHRSGAYSFRMDLDGGSCLYRYEPGLLKVQPGTHYRLEGYCRTTVLRYARARLTAYFTDQDLHPLPATVRHSDLYAGNGEDDDWHLLAVEVTADQDRAAFLVIEMELLQPSQHSTSTLGQRTLFLQDIHGTAWFDDVAVTQVPQVTLKTNRPGNIFSQGDPLKLTVLVNDRDTDDLAIQLVVSDAEDRRVYQHTGAIDLSTAAVMGPGLRELTLTLPNEPPGWYRASLVMMSHGVYVGQESLAWIQLADDGTPAAPDPRFGMTATDLPFAAWDDLPKVLPMLAVGRVKLALWSGRDEVQEMDGERLDNILQHLQSLDIAPTGCLIGLPPKMSEAMGGATWLQVLTAAPDTWQTPLSYLISRHANRLDRWQLGADDTDEFAVNPDMRKAYAKVYQQFNNLIDKPDLAMPCPLMYELPVPMPMSVELSVPTSIIPAELPLYLQEFHGHEGICLSLSALDRAQYDRLTRIRDLAKRVVYSLASEVPKFDLPLPIDARRQGDQLSIEPQELVIIERTLLSALSGAQFRGKLPIGEDADAFLFEKNRHGIVVVWSKNDSVPEQTLSVNIGEQLSRLDLWGNQIALTRGAIPQGDDYTEPNAHAKLSGLVKIKIGRTPVILTGVDSEMCRLRVSLGFDQPLIESTFQSHTRHVRFTNPYNQPIGGMIKLHAPPGWNFNPPTFTFTLNPGESFDREVAIEFPYNGVAGPQAVSADFNLQADRHLVFNQPMNLTLGLSDVGTQCMAYRAGTDVIVQQMISNYGEKPISYSAFAAFPGRPRIERLVTSLNPGQTVIKKYRFLNVPAGRLTRIRVGMKEVEGTRLLNDDVEIQ